MSANEDNHPVLERPTPPVSPGNYSPVTVHMQDTVGAVFLGILAVFLFIGWRRAEARLRALLSKGNLTNENRSLA